MLMPAGCLDTPGTGPSSSPSTQTTSASSSSGTWSGRQTPGPSSVSRPFSSRWVRSSAGVSKHSQCECNSDTPKMQCWQLYVSCALTCVAVVFTLYLLSVCIKCCSVGAASCSYYLGLFTNHQNVHWFTGFIVGYTVSTTFLLFVIVFMNSESSSYLNNPRSAFREASQKNNHRKFDKCLPCLLLFWQLSNFLWLFFKGFLMLTVDQFMIDTWFYWQILQVKFHFVPFICQPPALNHSFLTPHISVDVIPLLSEIFLKI